MSQTPQLHEGQKTAVRQVVQKMNFANVLLNAPVGYGKTVMAYKIIEEVTRKNEDPSKVTYILVIVPSLSGSVPKQWKAQSEKWNVQGEVFIYHGPNRNFVLDEYLSCSMRRVGNRYVITTIETIEEQFKRDEQHKSSFCRIPWKYVVVDESHKFRNGTNRFKSDVIDPDKKRIYVLYSLLNRLKPRVLLLTATPFVNNTLDLFPQLVLLDTDAREINKNTWLRSRDDVTSNSRFQKEKDYLLQKHLVCAPVISDMPTASVELFPHLPTENEVSHILYHNMSLKKKTRQLVYAMRCLFQVKTPVNEKRCKDAQMRWLAQFTVCRRGLIHPGFFEKASFFLKPSDIGKHIYVKGPKMKVEHVPVNIDWRFDSAKTRDEHFKDTNDKSITRGSSFEGKLIEVTEPKQGRSFCTIQNDEKCYIFPNPYEKIDPYKYLKEFDITDLSRFQAVMYLLNVWSVHKVVVTAAYKAPLQLLAVYIKKSQPARTVLEHYGSQPNNWSIIRTFFEPGPHILIATVSSISEAISLECANHMICVDPSTSDAQDKQRRGRIVRPLAQHFDAYYTIDTYAKYSIEPWLHQMQATKKLDAGVFFCGVDDNEDPDDERDSERKQMHPNNLESLMELIDKVNDDLYRIYPQFPRHFQELEVATRNHFQERESVISNAAEATTKKRRIVVSDGDDD